MEAFVGKNEVINSHLFRFSREAVFNAWTTPEQLARWWGPKGFTNTFHECDVRLDGHWRFVMHGPNGVDYSNHSVFKEIVPWERIVIHHLNAPEFLITATFEELDGGTKLTFRQVFMNSAVFEGAKAFLVEANEQNLERLNELLAELSE